MENSSPARPETGSTGVAHFRRRKLELVLGIMGVGMLAAVAWAAVQGWGFEKRYPHNTFLFTPIDRFNDFSDMTIDAGRDNPYLDPFGIYLPFGWVFFRLFSMLPYYFGLTTFLFVGTGGLFMVLVAALQETVSPAWERIMLSLALLLLSYPVLIAVDRGNLEIYLACLVAGAIYFLARARYGLATLCLILSVSFKLYPALFFLLLLRQRRMACIAGGILAFLIILFLSFWVLSLPIVTGFEDYGRNLVFLNRAYVDENYALEGSASLWNVYKVALITAAQLGLIRPVDFSFDNRFVVDSCTVYSAIMTLIAVGLALYVCLVEKEFLRSAVVLLLYLSVSTPLGADYRLLYANIALVAVVLLKTRRRYDFTALILLALAMVPKKEIILAYCGRTETNTADVSIQVVLDPLLIAVALGLLICDGLGLWDARWSWLRGRRLTRSLVILPWSSRP